MKEKRGYALHIEVNPLFYAYVRNACLHRYLNGMLASSVGDNVAILVGKRITGPNPLYF